MLDRQVIQSRGFKNVVGGFQVAVRCPYYRGLWASLIEGTSLRVGDIAHVDEQVRWTLGGITYTLSELAASDEVRWPYEEPAILTVDHADGLAPGAYEVEVGITWRWSYIPVERQPTVAVSSRKLVLVA